MPFSKKIKEVIDITIRDFIDLISLKYKLDAKELNDIWNNKLHLNSDKKTKDNICQHIFTRGPRKGEQCDCKIKLDCKFCSKHQKKDDTTSNKKIILRKNPVINKLWHSPTSLVFKSEEDKIVIEKYTDKSVQLLSDSDIEVCKKMNFKYEIGSKLQTLNDKAHDLENILQKLQNKTIYTSDNDEDDD